MSNASLTYGNFYMKYAKEKHTERLRHPGDKGRSTPILRKDSAEKITAKDKPKKNNWLSKEEGGGARQSLVEPVPKLNSAEISERIKKYPIKKSEMIEYLLRIHKVDRKLDPKTWENLQACEGFKEILDEVSLLRQKKREAKKIMQLCELAQMETKHSLEKIDLSITDERLRTNEFNTTYNMIKELEICVPAAFSLLYAFKVDDIKAQIDMSQEEVADYKNGKNDPGRVAEKERYARQVAARRRRKAQKREA